jgi:hypothetical protein
MSRINLNDRPTPNGSFEERLSPKIAEDRLNAKLGPRLPKIRETSDRVLDPTNKSGRRDRIGLPERFR